MLQLWPRALSLWSPYLRLGAPRWLTQTEDIAAEGLDGQLASFHLGRRQVLLNGRLLAGRGLLPHLFAVLCHEIGHYACSPGSAELHARLCARAFAALGAHGRQDLTQTAVNLYEDLLINTRLQLDKRLDMVPLLQALRPAGEAWSWSLRVCEIRWRLPAGTLCAPLSDDAEADALLAARLIQPRSRDLLAQMHAFADLCAAHLPDADPLLDAPQGLEGQPAGLLLDPGPVPSAADEPGGAARSAATRQYLEPADYLALLEQAGLGGRDALARYYRERAWPWLLPELAAPTSLWEPQHPEGTRPWELDRPVADIDWTASLVQSPVVVPGMTTLRRRQAWEPEPGPGPQRPRRLDLWLDASGSLPDPAGLCSPLVLAATILCLSALRLGLPVRVTCYSGAEQIRGTDYSRNASLLLETLTTYFGGATSFPLALLEARYRQPQPETALMLLSDEGWRAALLPTAGGTPGDRLLTRAAGSAASATLLLHLLRPELTPPELEPLIQAGWRLQPLQPERPQSLKNLLPVSG